MSSKPVITISTVPGNLHVASLPKEKIPEFTHVLLQVLFFQKSTDRFVNFTETPEEVSLILDEASVRLFPPNSLKTSDEPWRGVQITVGAGPYESGIVRQIAAPLGKANINIFYFTTSSTDFILVPVSKFKKAKAVLKKNFSLQWEDDDEVDSPVLIEEREEVGPCNTLADFNQLLGLPDLSLQLASIRPEQFNSCVRDLIQLIFFPTNTHRFFSFTQLEDEISLIIDEKTLASFPAENLEVVFNSRWAPIKRLHKAGFTETGVVSALSAPLAEAKISLLYMSSFQTAYIFVQKTEYEKAVQKLMAANFVVSSKLHVNESQPVTTSDKGEL